MQFLPHQRFIYLFGVLHHFQHCTGHITTGSRKGRGNQYIHLVKVLYCKLHTNSKQIPAFPQLPRLGTEPWPQRWETTVASNPSKKEVNTLWGKLRCAMSWCDLDAIFDLVMVTLTILILCGLHLGKSKDHEVDTYAPVPPKD